MKKCVLGFDTSNYTTSLAIVSEDMQLVENLKIPLKVARGERGLRQSDAVFSHVKNLPEIMSMAQPALREMQVCGIGVSARPRNQTGSYMPCFLSGVSAATAAAVTADVPLLTWSHQCGHIMAAAMGSGAGEIVNEPFIAFHVSGGTTEVVLATLEEGGFKAQVIGGSLDLHAGQVVDRVGVSLGMEFPAGPALEAAAKQYTGRIPKKKIATEDGYIHLSGLENMARQAFAETADVSYTAALVFDYLGRSLVYLATAARERYGSLPIVFGGGVMSSSLLRGYLENLGDVYFAPPALSSDNGAGVAYLTAQKIFH